MNQTRQILAAWLVVAVVAGAAAADGMIVPVRPDIRVRGAWAVKYHHVTIQVREQVAAVTIDQEFVNTGRGMIEVEYLFPVPPQAAIDAMRLLVDGREFEAKLYKADEARKIYEEIVRRKKDPALLEYAGFGLIKTRAFPLQPGKPARVVVTYKNTCKKDQDTVEVWYPLNTEKFSSRPIEDVAVKVDIKSKADLLAPYSPTHDIVVERKGPSHVVVSYQAKKVLPTTDFQVFYDESSKDIGATLLTHQPDAGKDGYFMLLVSPNPRTAGRNVAAKDVVVAFDRSGSMSGEKIEQAKEALRFILGRLNEEDRFNIVAFNDRVEALFDGLVEVSKDNCQQAEDRLDRIEANGATDIHGALAAAMGMCDDRQAGNDAADRPKYILFLTDGLPTANVVDEGEILKKLAKANPGRARLFTFGVGYDVNVRLLDKLVRDHRGRSDYVKPKEPIERKVSSLYAKIRNPVMTDLQIRIDGLRLRDVYPNELGDLFAGDQIVAVGRYEPKGEARGKAAGGGPAQLVVTGVYEGQKRGFEYSVTVCRPGRAGHDFVEKLWAIRRVGYLLDQVQLHGESQEIIDELVRLSKDYGIMTPYTAFLADERTDLAMKAGLRRSAGRVLAEQKAGDITGGAAQRNATNRELLNAASRPMSARGAYGGPAAQVQGNSDMDSYEAGRQETVANVRQIGNQALYRRGRLWVAANASALDLKRDAGKIVEVQLFSEKYFALVRTNSDAENQIFASQQPDEELLITLRGQTYRIR